MSVKYNFATINVDEAFSLGKCSAAFVENCEALSRFSFLFPFASAFKLFVRKRIVKYFVLLLLILFK